MSNRAISTELIELGERIRKRRQEMKLSQESFAEKAGISVNTVSRIEGGQTVTLAIRPRKHWICCRNYMKKSWSLIQERTASS